VTKQSLVDLAVGLVIALAAFAIPGTAGVDPDQR
jgi:hypothetical protein